MLTLTQKTGEKFSLKILEEVGILQNNHLQTGWGMSTSPTAILADFDDNASSYHYWW